MLGYPNMGLENLDNKFSSVTVLYNGSLADQMAGFVSAEDLSAYSVVSNTCLQSVVGPLNVAVAGPSSGGPLLLQLLLKINQSMAITAPILSVALNLKGN